MILLGSYEERKTKGHDSTMYKQLYIFLFVNRTHYPLIQTKYYMPALNFTLITINIWNIDILTNMLILKFYDNIYDICINFDIKYIDEYNKYFNIIFLNILPRGLQYSIYPFQYIIYIILEPKCCNHWLLSWTSIVTRNKLFFPSNQKVLRF